MTTPGPDDGSDDASPGAAADDDRPTDVGERTADAGQRPADDGGSHARRGGPDAPSGASRVGGAADPPTSHAARDAGGAGREDGGSDGSGGLARGLRDVGSSVAAVAVVGVVLFAISGIWPPLVAVESGSMQPHMQKGDLVFIMDERRITPPGAVAGTGVVTFRSGEETGFRSFGEYGNVIVYEPNGRDTTPIIHRARFWVEEDENWYGEAEKRFLNGARNCRELQHCPAKHAGFITLGDANGAYDQAVGRSAPVKPSWIKGTAKVRIPWLGYVRLQFGQVVN